MRFAWWLDGRVLNVGNKGFFVVVGAGWRGLDMWCEMDGDGAPYSGAFSSMVRAEHS